MAIKIPVAVLLSGQGSNLQALIDACAAPDYPARIVLVLSNREDAYGVTRAAKAGIPAKVISHRDYPNRETFDDAMHATITASGAKIVCLAGFMRLLSPGFVARWEGRMLNIHPSLLPDFKGMDAVGQALAAGVKTAGCSVHLVTAEMDAGPVVLQEQVPVLPSDTLETLTQRIHAAEHRIYPEALRRLARAI